MKYVINFTIIYSPADKQLSLLNDSNHEITLSNQAARLLLEMVTNSNETLHREDLLKRVWEDYGFTRSNNSLNVAVSEIRKSFESLGKDPKIIITIPKVGFRFEGAVEPVIEQGEDNDFPINESEASLKHPADKTIFIRPKNQQIKKFVICMTFVFLCGYASYEAFIKFKHLNVHHEKTIFLYSVGKCDVYALGDLPIDVGENYIDIAKQDINKEVINCDLAKGNIYYKKTRSGSQDTQISFIGICGLDKNNKPKDCRSILNNIGVNR
ncbi:winged helix-turn-helix domain-containing protein [Xenorhabdus bovienii]|uniref:winged helix-turn-helix domain-containing protein n=1 Tax=Xenorhabdus bovienii TaxID=40576 RepID=UPI0023B24748|nr:winged helix-turn-helix domain-containing protein [Xenorhabdus bovienii]MDE9436788.1 winged helix-turn-helix domain-containing protein [Xenorhabdus bovienii]MDE9498513.1 winged helix-turn-helix domain-containing protein [Xenorhabdus bovienii]